MRLLRYFLRIDTLNLSYFEHWFFDKKVWVNQILEIYYLKVKIYKNLIFRFLIFLFINLYSACYPVCIGVFLVKCVLFLVICVR